MPVDFTSRVVSITQMNRIAAQAEGTYGIYEISGTVGGAVTAQGPATLTVDVAQLANNTYQIADALEGNIAAGTVTHDTADATNPRIDIVFANAGGAFGISKGTAAATPVPPALLSSELELAMVLVGAGVTTITSGDIFDRRAVIRQKVGTKGADLASSGTLVLGNDQFYDITGTTTVTALQARPVGYIYILQFDDVLTFTHGANLILAGGVNITTFPGMVLILIAESGAFRELRPGPPESVMVKGADTARDTTTTLAADPDLTVTLDASAIYECEIFLHINDASTGTADFDFELVEPDGTFDMLVTGMGNAVLNAQIDEATGETFFATSGTADANALVIKGYILTAGAGGTFALHWAQSTSNGASLTVEKGSFMKVRRIA